MRKVTAKELRSLWKVGIFGNVTWRDLKRRWNRIPRPDRGRVLTGARTLNMARERLQAADVIRQLAKGEK